MRLEQMRHAFESIIHFTHSLSTDFTPPEGSSAHYHLIMCGDFNTTPSTPLYKLLTMPDAINLFASGSLSISQFLPRQSMFNPAERSGTDKKMSTSQLGNLEKFCAKIGKEVNEVTTPEFFESFTSQRRIETINSIKRFRSFPSLNSAYGRYRNVNPEADVSCEDFEGFKDWKGEPVFTSFEGNFKGTFDYIFTIGPKRSPPLLSLSPSSSQTSTSTSSSSSSSSSPPLPGLLDGEIMEDEIFQLFRSSSFLTPVSLLRIPSVAQLSVQVALPNEMNGSDHIPIACNFALVYS